MTFYAPRSARAYRVAIVLVTALRWLIESSMAHRAEPAAASPADAPLRGHLKGFLDSYYAGIFDEVTRSIALHSNIRYVLKGGQGRSIPSHQLEKKTLSRYCGDRLTRWNS